MFQIIFVYIVSSRASQALCRHILKVIIKQILYMSHIKYHCVTLIFLKLVFYKLYKICECTFPYLRNCTTEPVMYSSFICPTCKSPNQIIQICSKRGYPWKPLTDFMGYRMAWLLIGFSLREYHTNAQQSAMTANLLPSMMQGIACGHQSHVW